MASSPPPQTGDSSSSSTAQAPQKPIHSLVVDTGPLIKNDPSVDVLRSRSEQLYILPSVIPEIRDAATRTRVETALLPFVTLRSPKPESIKFVTGFARRTGDLEVLSRPDIEVLALTYELECERNGGDWRLRSTPGQKTLNGAAHGQQASDGNEQTRAAEDATEPTPKDAEAPAAPASGDAETLGDGVQKLDLGSSAPQEEEQKAAPEEPARAEDGAKEAAREEPKSGDDQGGSHADDEAAAEEPVVVEDGEDDENEENQDDDDDEDDDGGGWITPSNLKKHKAKDDRTAAAPGKQVSTLQAAVLTSDFAMQNVALRMNLNLVSPSMSRISRLKTWVLRCHGCFKITRDMGRRFCPTCGQPTLLRAACTVDDRTGALTVHLKRNFQWNNRGNVYSVPKPVPGSASGRAAKGKGRSSAGGKNGWGRDLILAEDQKEHVRAADEQRRARKKDIMDEDSMPSILTGDRRGSGGRIRVGAGRNVNSRKRH